MKGYPHWLNTRYDYEYVAENFEPNLWKPDWQALLDDIMQWQFVSDLASRDEGIEDATHRIEESDRGDGVIVYEQWEYKKDDHARLYRLGFTEEEVEAKLAEPDPEPESEPEPEEYAPADAEGETTVESETTDASLTDEVTAEETPVEAPAEESVAPAEDPDAPAEPAPTEEVAEEES